MQPNPKFQLFFPCPVWYTVIRLSAYICGKKHNYSLKFLERMNYWICLLLQISMLIPSVSTSAASKHGLTVLYFM